MGHFFILPSAHAKAGSTPARLLMYSEVHIVFNQYYVFAVGLIVLSAIGLYISKR